MLPEPFRWPEKLPLTREEAVKFALDAIEAPHSASNIQRVEGALPRLYRMRDGAFEPAWRPAARGILITWETLA